MPGENVERGGQLVEKVKYKKPKWYRQTERLLKKHKYLPMEIDNLLLQLRLTQLAGPSITFQPREITTQYMPGGGSSTEAIYLKEESLDEKIERKQILLTMIDNAIRTFNEEERLVYKLRYESELREKEIYPRLKMGRSTYFELQRRTVMKAARVLNIPIPGDEQPDEWLGELFLKCSGLNLD